MLAAVDFRGERDQFVGDLNRIGRARLQPAQGLGQPLELALGARPYLIERRCRLHPPAVPHDELEQRLAVTPAFR